MNRIEYEHAIGKAKAARSWKNEDPAARLAFERDFADPVDDARAHLPPEDHLDDERYRQRQLFARTRRAA